MGLKDIKKSKDFLGLNKKKRKVKNKKGMFFTIISIIILSIFVLGYGIYSLSENQTSINRRIETMNSFVYSVEQDLPRQLYITGFRVIFLSEKRIIETGVPITNFSNTFMEAFYNGTINGEIQPLMAGATIGDLKNQLSNISRIMNLNGTFNPKRIIVSQEDSWNIKINMETELYINDLGNLASWNNTKNFTTYIPIENFEDPLYRLYSAGIAFNKIYRSPYQPFVNGNDVSNLTKHVEGFYYINSTISPSFIDRLEGRIVSSPYGIESLVDSQKLSSQGIPIKDTSVVDYLYLPSNMTSKNNILGMPGWFKLDGSHLEIYNVTGLVV
ncbi:MAG: hypothetical protein WC867_01605 [Candidatus Pacearchaeota archaeon]|jgi:hypothetical protein